MDKIKHFLVGLSVSLVAGIWYTPGLGLTCAALSGIWKEVVWDRLLKKGTPELLDFVATMVGGVVGYALLRLI